MSLLSISLESERTFFFEFWGGDTHLMLTSILQGRHCSRPNYVSERAASGTSKVLGGR